MIFEFSKRPGEREIISVDMSKRMPTGTTITNIMVTATTLKGNSTLTVTDALVGGTSGKIVSAIVEGGEVNHLFQVLFRVTLSDTQIKENLVNVSIKEDA